ncbi:NAD(P)-dependent oxidoreductase [Streptomyces sp. NRRL B-3648]|uniref:NAD(P)-dependent oxidoreductase n=1 Tax=Streptomyces sp. NRRL B-3648 TaxID=1519493 RepID=UPI0006AFEFF2|nr:NAD(P)-dependent oxidoreductase [Streptomyces sp. NRRL B-3648]KOV89428.1 3-hydroxyisobutyrate dehydrogenase [Streptomyces sp. NRRL B-3648]
MTGRHIAFIGLGSMGSGMALRLLDSGFRVTVYNRTRERALPVAEAGAELADSAARAAAAAEVLLLSVADEDAVEELLFHRIVLRPGVLVVNTSTVSPKYARDAGARVEKAGARWIDACVIGNPAQAREGSMRVLASGAPEDVEAADPVLRALGSTVVPLGPVGRAPAMKLAFNLLLGAQVASLADAVRYGERAGLDRDLLLAAIGASGFSSKVMSFRADLMRSGRFQPAAFRAGLMHKDLRLVVEEARDLGLELTVTETAAGYFERAVAEGKGDFDAAVVGEAPA